MQSQQPVPFVTILIPCRNEQAFIAGCLDSILYNGYPSDRLLVLVMDGMSDDGTRTVLEGYARNHECVRVIDNQGRTTPKALNLGLREARGSVVFRVDAHARLSAGYLRRCVDALQEYGADVVCGVMRTVPSAAGLMGRAIAAALAHPFGVGNSYFRIHVSLPTWVDTVFCGCYRREAFDRVLARGPSIGRKAEGGGDADVENEGPFNVALARGQDMDFSTRLQKAGGRMLLLPDTSSEYFARSTIRSFWTQNWNNGVWAILPFAYSESLSISVRHLVPLGFVLSVIATAIAGVALPAFLWASAGIVGLYGVVNVAASLQAAWRERSLPLALLLPLVFLTLHVGYGLGSLWGVARLAGLPQFWGRMRWSGSRRTAAMVSGERV